MFGSYVCGSYVCLKYMFDIIISIYI